MGEENCSVETSFGFLLFFCLLVFKDYRKEALEITGLESGCNERKRDCQEYAFDGRSILKSLGSADLLENREQFLQLDSNSGTFGPFRSCKTIYIVLASVCDQPAEQIEVLGDI